VFARLLGVDSPRRLARALGALTLVGESRRALVTSGLLWVLLYTGWETGIVDAEATIWLSAGVVLAALRGQGGERDEYPVQSGRAAPGSYRRQPGGPNCRRPEK